LSSATPYDADQTPVEVLADAGDPNFLGAALSSPSLVTPEGGHNMLAMIAPAKLDQEKRCLAQAIYFEARGEPETGQAAVAQVVLNRMTSGLYPSSICGVVFQNRSHYKACQFSFACEGRSLRIHDADSWAQAQRLADDALQGRGWLAQVGGSTYYHANYVRPRWARALQKMDVIGRHIFYRLKDG
jgi:spore germination cell wall hydrolase CwlJ-like protein